MSYYLHTPTDEEVRGAITRFDLAWTDGGAAFDRWLAARDAAALTAAAPHMEAALLRRIEVQAFIIAERDKELMQIQGPCRAPGCGLHRAHNGPCTIREGKSE